MTPIKKTAWVLGFLSVAGVALEAGAAGNVNIPATMCNPLHGKDVADIEYLSSGVRTAAAAAGTRAVVCAVPHSPVSTPDQTFFVDGSNSSGHSTSCALSSFTFDGTFNTSVSFVESAATYDRRANLFSVGFFDYVSLVCNLPANGGGVLFGVLAEGD